METVIPTCRYGHGRLERQPGIWSLSQLDMEGEMPDGSWSTGVQFVASLYRCPACGMLELLDDDDAST